MEAVKIPPWAVLNAGHKADLDLACYFAEQHTDQHRGAWTSGPQSTLIFGE